MNLDSTKDFVKILASFEAGLGEVKYDDPNWTIKQAHLAGQRHMIAKVRSLLTYE